MIFWYLIGSSSYSLKYAGGLNHPDIHPSNVGLNRSLHSYKTSYHAIRMYAAVASKNAMTIL